MRKAESPTARTEGFDVTSWRRQRLSRRWRTRPMGADWRWRGGDGGKRCPRLLGCACRQRKETGRSRRSHTLDERIDESEMNQQTRGNCGRQCAPGFAFTDRGQEPRPGASQPASQPGQLGRRRWLGQVGQGFSPGEGAIRTRAIHNARLFELQLGCNVGIRGLETGRFCPMHGACTTYKSPGLVGWIIAFVDQPAFNSCRRPEFNEVGFRSAAYPIPLSGIDTALYGCGREELEVGRPICSTTTQIGSC